MAREGMASAELRIPPRPDQVRTARLVAAAAARRAGLDAETVDDVRLAVGEAVTRAVLRERDTGVDSEIIIGMSDDGEVFTVTVSDSAPATGEPDGGVALTVAVRLATGGEHHTTEAGSVVHLLWPAV
jgi:anti-sigma regulatory factor (Ser/Thr protein kinase)